MNYKDKVVIVTGASSGIGFDTALCFAQKGAIVIGVARRETLLRELQSACREYSPMSSYIVADLGVRAEVEKAIDMVIQTHGGLDIVINNAAVPIHKSIFDVSLGDMENIMDVNFMSCAWMTLASLPHLLVRGGGSIVNVSSFASQVSPPRETPYSASKCAMDGFTAGLWSDLAGSNIHAALVLPGPIDTQIWDKDDSPSAYSGPKYPPRIVTEAIFKSIEKKRHEVIVPRFSISLIAARLLRFFAPSLLLKGMAMMEPPDVETIERKRRELKEKIGI